MTVYVSVSHLTVSNVYVSLSHLTVSNDGVRVCFTPDFVQLVSVCVIV